MDAKDMEIQRLQNHVRELQQKLGVWMRKAKEKPPRRDCIREGHRQGDHYKVFVVEDIPGDLSVVDMLEELKKDFLPSVHPFQYRGLDYSNRWDGWLVEVAKPLRIDMYVEDPEFAKKLGNVEHIALE